MIYHKLSKIGLLSLCAAERSVEAPGSQKEGIRCSSFPAERKIHDVIVPKNRRSQPDIRLRYARKLGFLAKYWHRMEGGYIAERRKPALTSPKPACLSGLAFCLNPLRSALFGLHNINYEASHATAN